MAQPAFIQEWDPATGKFVVGMMPDVFFVDDDGSNLVGSVVAAAQPSRSIPARAGVHPGFAPGPTPADRRLSKEGKEKLRQCVHLATSIEELEEIETALNSGYFSETLAAKFGLTTSDFEPATAQFGPPAAAPSAIGPPCVRHVDLGGGWVRAVPEEKPPEPPIGAYGLTPSGFFKVIDAVEAATEMQRLDALDKALKKGDMVRLREILGLLDEDVRSDFVAAAARKGDVDAETDASDSDDEEDYDPFTYDPYGDAKVAATASGRVDDPVPVEPSPAAESSISPEAAEEVEVATAGIAALAPDAEILAELAAAAPDASPPPPACKQAVDGGKVPEGLDAAAVALPPPLPPAATQAVPEELHATAAAPSPPPVARQVVDDAQILAELGAAASAVPTRVPTQAAAENGVPAQVDAGAAPSPALVRARPRKRKRSSKADHAFARSMLRTFMGDYEESEQESDEESTSGSETQGEHEPQEAEPLKPLAWPLELAWLSSRTMGHPDFRPLPRSECSRCAGQWPPHKAGAAKSQRTPPVSFAALSVSLVYVGDASTGFDPRRPGRIAAVDEQGGVLLDVVIRPQAPLLDCRTHLTGLTPQCLEAESAVDLDTACGRLMALLSPDTLLAGYRVVHELQALGVWHGALIDVALLYGVESRKSQQYHSLRFMAEQVLREDLGPGDDDPNDAVERARLTMRLVHHEARHQVPTPPFPPREPGGCEFLVRHIPRSWGASAAATLQPLMPGARLSAAVRWLLNDDDPTDWRGEARWAFHSKGLCDAAFAALPGLTDVHVSWQDQPGALPLGTFLSEQALIMAFSAFGVVISARVPRKPMTKEPQSFAFISFLEEEDAKRVAKRPVVEAQITPEWKLNLRPRLAKYSSDVDKRVGVRVSVGPTAEWEFDWVHVCRR